MGVLNWLPGLTARPHRQTTAARTLILTACVVGLLYITYVTTGKIDPRHFGGRRSKPEPESIQSKEIRSMRVAGNRTLGFSSIKFINMPTRYDRLDAMTLQAYLAGIDFDQVPAVDVEHIKDVSMPPNSIPNGQPPLKAAEKGCWRAHANIWSEMIRTRSGPVFILESDAAWDVNLRPIMALFNKHFTRFLQKSGSRPLYQSNHTQSSKNMFHLPCESAPTGGKEDSHEDGRSDDYGDGSQYADANKPWYEADEASKKLKPNSTISPDPDDPWHSEHWDLLSLGQCFDQQLDPTTHLRYADPFSPPGKDYFGQRLGHECVIHASGGLVCTTAYAVTLRGAAKLLIRTAMDLDLPVDLVMQSMIMTGELVTYSMIPTVMAQWNYVSDIGMEQRGANSDIQGTMAEIIDPEKESSPDDMVGWNEAKALKNVWTLKTYHPNAGFRQMALQVAWRRRIFSKEKDIVVGLT